MNLNMTDLGYMNNDQIVSTFHQQLTVTPLAVSYIVSIVLLLLGGLFWSSSGSRKKYFMIVGIYALFFGSFIAALIFLPTSFTQWLNDCCFRLFN